MVASRVTRCVCLPTFGASLNNTPALDVAKAKRVRQTQKRVNVDFPTWMIESLDREASNPES